MPPCNQQHGSVSQTVLGSRTKIFLDTTQVKLSFIYFLIMSQDSFFRNEEIFVLINAQVVHCNGFFKLLNADIPDLDKLSGYSLQLIRRFYVARHNPASVNDKEFMVVTAGDFFSFNSNVADNGPQCLPGHIDKTFFRFFAFFIKAKH